MRRHPILMDQVIWARTYRHAWQKLYTEGDAPDPDDAMQEVLSGFLARSGLPLLVETRAASGVGQTRRMVDLINRALVRSKDLHQKYARHMIALFGLLEPLQGWDIDLALAMV